MGRVALSACAKLNLTLDVQRKRPDGYHDLRMVMQTVSLADRVTVEQGGGPGIAVRSNLAFLPTDGRNLAAAAALRFGEATGIAVGDLLIDIQKSIPVCAGMAGGSSDAAAVLRALNELTGAGLTPAALAEIGSGVGSDVPYCVYGGTALVEGRGEQVTPLAPLPPCWFVICKPSFLVSTPVLFSKLRCERIGRRPDTAGVLEALDRGDLGGVARRLYNVFPDVLPGRHRDEVQELATALIGQGALGAAMSGTGPTVFGLFSEGGAAEVARAVMAERCREVFLATAVPGTQEN